MAQNKEQQEIVSRYEQFSHFVADCDPRFRPNRTPHLHQEATWRKLSNCSSPRRGIIALPTGAGKTYTAIKWLATTVLSDPNLRSVLWIAHRAELLQQAAEEFFNCRGLCKRDAPLTVRCISGAHGKPISSLISGADVTLVTIQSLSGRMDLVEKYFEINTDAVVVVDEAHHAAAKSYREVLTTATKRRRKVEIIGLTATPTRTIQAEVKHLKKIFPDEIIHQVTMAELIEKGILSVPYCKTVTTNSNFDKTFTPKELEHLKRFGELPATVLAKIGRSTSRNKLIVNHYADNSAEYGKTLVFATNIPHCYSLAETFNKCDVSADYIASQRHDAKSNKDIMDRYRRGEIKVLVSVEMLTEGVDLPSTETVFLARPTGSEILMRQMVGRALRGPKAGGSAEARIVSFADHWERFPGWLDPISLLPLGEPSEETSKTHKPMFPVHIPWELISAISALAPDIQLSEVFSNTPVGWYELSAGSPDSGLTTAILVYDHQKEAFDRFIADSLKGEFVLSGRGGGAAQYFSDVPDPIPSNEQLAILSKYIAEFRKPKYMSFSERALFDPRVIADKYSTLNAIQLRDQALKIYESTLASTLYPSSDEYVAAIFDALGRLMTKAAGPVDEILPVRSTRRKAPPYKNWPLKSIMKNVREEMKLTNKPAPKIRWSKRPSKSTWAVYRHFDTSIVVNCFLKTESVEKRTMEFLVYHELLHHELGCKEGHSRYFRERERKFPGYAEADSNLATLTERIGQPRVILDW